MSLTPLPRLYLISDRHQTAGRPLSFVLTEALKGGARLIQLRERDVETVDLCRLIQDLSPVMTTYQAEWLINDRVDLVLALNARGVHLRSDSLPPSIVRPMVGPDRLIGVSAHSLEEVRAGEAGDANFAVAGPVFDTPSKRAFGKPLGVEHFSHICQNARLPIFAIGGITPERVTEVLEAGAYGVAVISSILQSTRIQETTEKFLDLLS